MENKEIDIVIHQAINLMRETFGGTEVQLISDKMFRSTPNKECPLGCLGVTITVEGKKHFYDILMPKTWLVILMEYLLCKNISTIY